MLIIKRLGKIYDKAYPDGKLGERRSGVSQISKFIIAQIDIKSQTAF